MARATRQRRANDDGADDTPPVKVARDAKPHALGCGIPPLQVPLAQRAQWDEFLRTKCLMRVGADFYDLFELACSISSEKPLETLGIQLCGPFDLLACAMHASDVTFSTPLFLHGRYFLDPPEVTTVLKDVKNGDVGAHWGYFRDTPEQTPAIAALARKRSNEATASSLHQFGVVVPYDAKKKTGFRELPVKGAQLEALIEQVRNGDDPSARKKLSGLITRATIATDECDFGTSLLLGLDLFTAGAALE
uniref:Uncharacterized protein n=1 Tax=Globisporangium ultimum (strain ATCC 200006 / CBS 805.95 / DAOM BR144) TaxID=431595 RepID=K3WN34_GLOUD